MKAIREKDPKRKDQYTVKYLQMFEIPESDLSAAKLPHKTQQLLQRTDVILLLFEANDSE